MAFPFPFQVASRELLGYTRVGWACSFSDTDIDLKSLSQACHVSNNQETKVFFFLKQFDKVVLTLHFNSNFFLDDLQSLLPLFDKIKEFSIVWILTGRGPTSLRNQHQFGIIGRDFHLEVHPFLKVLFHRVAVIWFQILIRLVHVHCKGKVAELSCR